MFKFAILFILNLWTCFTFASETFNYEFSNLNLSAEASAQISKIFQHEDVNVMLAEVKSAFPELQILVLPQTVKSTINGKPFGGDTIVWRDSEVSAATQDWYVQSIRLFLSPSGLGFFLAPHEYNSVGRPSSDKPILFFYSNVPTYVIKHELLHYLLYQQRLQVGLKTETGSGFQQTILNQIQALSKQLDSMEADGKSYESEADVLVFIRYYTIMSELLKFGDAEELDVSSIIIKHAKQLNINDEGVAFHLAYMDANFKTVLQKITEIHEAILLLGRAKAPFPSKKIEAHLANLKMKMITVFEAYASHKKLEASFYKTSKQ